MNKCLCHSSRVCVCVYVSTVGVLDDRPNNNGLVDSVEGILDNYLYDCMNEITMDGMSQR